MSEILANENPTFLSPVMFPDGNDRRKSARIPLSTPVRVGPPNGTPYALVSATDLSKDGLFIDADRPVRVGARFCAEIELSDSKIYIPEAEVAYNRDRSTGSGFGVRFIAAEEEALLAVAEEVDRVTDQTLVVRDRSKNQSELPTLVPEAALGVEFSEYPEPEIVEEALIRDSAAPHSVIPPQTTEPPAPLARARYALKDTRHRFLERARRAPNVFRGLAIAGAAALIASAGFALFEGSQGDAIDARPVTTDRGVAASTHQVLMGKADVAALEKDSGATAKQPSDRKARRKSLPPLVVLEEEDEPQKVDPKKAEPKKVEPKKVEPKKAKKPEPKAHGPMSNTARAILGEPDGAPSRLRIGGIDSGATVLKTHVYEAPDRYVIDLIGQESALSIPSPDGRVRRIRTGRHPDYFRVVVDAGEPIDVGRASISGGTLQVEIHYR